MSSRALGLPVACWLLLAAIGHAASLDVADAWRWSGGFGLGVASTDGEPAYVETDVPDDETRLAVRFYFNASSPGFALAGPVTLFRALSESNAEIIDVVLQAGAPGLELVYTVTTDTGQQSTSAIPLVAGWHFLELEWGAATGDGADDGFLTTRLDDAPTAGLTGLDNDLSSISRARWGVVATGISHAGTLRLDDFASRRAGPIGPVLAGSLDLDGDGSEAPLTDGLLLIRAIFGFSGTVLTLDAVGPSCDWCDSAAIRERLVALAPVHDIDDDGSVMALTDGLLVLRYLFGLRGAVLVAGAVGQGAQRATATEIEAYIASLL